VKGAKGARSAKEARKRLGVIIEARILGVVYAPSLI
jgi:hypothetical protein